MKFEWSRCCERPLKNLKTILSTAPVLSAPDFSQQFKLAVDASDVAAGAVLLQEEADNIDNPV